MTKPVFSPGFRFSARDALVLVLGVIVSVVIQMSDLWIGIAIIFVVLHFFLFCNVLRITRPPELVWAAIFSGLAICATVWNVPTWPVVFAGSLAVTAVIACIEVRRDSYHGIGWQKINPRLPEWWQSHVAGKFQPAGEKK